MTDAPGIDFIFCRPMKARKEPPAITRSSAAEYLTYVASVGDTSESFEIRYADEDIWLTQKMLARLYGVEIPAII